MTSWGDAETAAHPGRFIPQLGRVMPLQVNLKTNAKPPREEYRSLDESRATLRAEGIDPDSI